MSDWMKKVANIIKEFEDQKIYVNMNTFTNHWGQKRFGIHAWIKPQHWTVSPYKTIEEAEKRFVQFVIEHSKSGVYYENTLV